MVITTDNEAAITLAVNQILEWTICCLESPDGGEQESLIMVRCCEGVANAGEEFKADKDEFYELVDKEKINENTACALISLERWNSMLRVHNNDSTSEVDFEFLRDKMRQTPVWLWVKIYSMIPCKCDNILVCKPKIDADKNTHLLDVRQLVCHCDAMLNSTRNTYCDRSDNPK